MSAHQLNLISQAQQGNPKAIADLLNRALEPKNIVTRAKLFQRCLTIFAEGPEVPNQQSLIGVIKRGIKDLDIDTLDSVKVYGKKTDASGKGWVDEIILNDSLDNSRFSATNGAKSSDFNWSELGQKCLAVGQELLIRGRKLATNKRFIIGATSFVLLALITTIGVVGFNVAQTRMAQREAISEARVLFSEAKISETSSMAELNSAADKLTEARDILRGVEESPWSLYDTAQDNLATVRKALEVVEGRISSEESAGSQWTAANTQAQQAIQSVNSPPYPVENWQTAKDELSKAISALTAIPDNSSYAGQKKQVLEQYQEKLAWINQGMSNEQKAAQVLQTGDTLAQQAYSYTNGKSRFQAAELTQAKALWQKAIDHTRTVPSTSDAYRQIAERIGLYTENANKIESELREMNECWSRSYASQSLCNSVYLSLKDPDFYID